MNVKEKVNSNMSSRVQNIIDPEEQKFLHEIKAQNSISSFISSIIDSYLNLEETYEKKDDYYTKILLVYNKHYGIEDCFLLKAVKGIQLRFSKYEKSFAERACFLAASLFKKNEFDIEKKTIFEEYKKFLPFDFLIEKNNKKIFSIFDQSQLIENKKFFANSSEPIFIQKALMILKEKVDIEQMNHVCSKMNNILKFTSNRIYEKKKEELFKYLTNLDVPKIFDTQFIALAELLYHDKSAFEKALEIFFENKIEVKKFYLIYTFCKLHFICDDEYKALIHIKFNEKFFSCSESFEPSVFNQIMIFLGLGLKFLHSFKSKSC